MNFLKKHLLKLFALIAFVQLAAISNVVLHRLGAFGCFDDCHTLVTAYFMLKGRELYSEIFYNHQMIMPYISYVIQRMTTPDTLFSLVQIHRLFIVGFSFIATAILIYRFRWQGVVFSLLYEPVKFYYFGDRFLPEALIPYLLAYLVGTIWHSLKDKKFTRIDAISSAVVTWLVVFLREPYVPVALFLFGTLLAINYKIKTIGFAALLFTALSIFILVSVPLSDYLFTIWTVNSKTVLASELQSTNILGSGIVTSILYPFSTLIVLPTTISGQILLGFSVLYSLMILFNISTKRNIVFIIITFVSLALAALRSVPPGYTYYEAFHMLPWLGVFIMILAVLSGQFYKNQKNSIRYGVPIVICAIWFFSLLSPQSFLYENVNPSEEFTIGYAHYQRSGDIIQVLSDSDDHAYVELWDDILYWQTGLDSSYTYGLYTPLMESFPKYSDQRLDMFAKHAPEFYYCSDGYTYKQEQLIPEEYKNDYIELLENDKPSCIYVRSDKVADITDEQWKSAESLGFTLPQE